jgi:glutamyl-tRNA reductase
MKMWKIEGVTTIHMLSQLTDETLENRKKTFLQLKLLLKIKEEFITWTKGRKFAPTIHALKAKLNAIKASELDFQSKKISTNEEQAEIISNRIIKNTTHFANHLKMMIQWSMKVSNGLRKCSRLVLHK